MRRKAIKTERGAGSVTTIRSQRFIMSVVAGSLLIGFVVAPCLTCHGPSVVTPEDQARLLIKELRDRRFEPTPWQRMLIRLHLGHLTRAKQLRGEPEIWADLARLGPAAIPVLVEALEYPPTRTSIIQAIGMFGPDAKDAVPALIEILRQDPKLGVRNSAAQSLGLIGPDARNAIPELIAGLKEKDSYMRLACAQALGRIGPDASDAVPDLIECLRDKSSLVQVHAAVSLGRIGPSARAAIPALTEFLKDQDEWYPDVLEAIERIQGK